MSTVVIECDNPLWRKNVRAKMRIKIIVGCGDHHRGIQITDAFPISICNKDYFVMIRHRNRWP